MSSAVVDVAEAEAWNGPAVAITEGAAAEVEAVVVAVGAEPVLVVAVAEVARRLLLVLVALALRFLSPVDVEVAAGG